MVRDFHATRNDYLLNSKVNITFDDTHHMNKRQFADWVVSLRKVIVYAWDKLDTPPKLGMTDDQIVRDFERLVDLDVSTLKKYDQQTNGWHCLTAPPNTGAGCVSFFPNIQKTKDIQGKDLTGYSLYDLFVDEDNLERLTNSLKRLYQADKLYAFSRCVFADNAMGGVSESTGKKWITEFQSNRPKDFKDWDFFIEVVPSNSKDKMPQGKLLSLSKKNIIELQGRGLLNKKHLTQVNSKETNGASKHRIRLFQKNQKVIEKGIRFWNTSLVQGGSNFPATIAKFIYTHFTEDLKKDRFT